MDKNLIRIMAEAERMMDEGLIPFVLAPSPSGLLERLAMTNELMKEFGLVQGQTINSMIRDAILEENLRRISKKIAEYEEKIYNSLTGINDENLDPNFDFRVLMNDNGENDE